MARFSWRPRSGKRRGAASAGSHPGQGPTKAEADAALAHLKDFVKTRVGVEMYVEPRTSVTPTTVVLIATTGEWTRRRVSGPAAAAQLAQDLDVPVYDVQQMGYPARMRAWTAQQASQQRQHERDQRSAGGGAIN